MIPPSPDASPSNPPPRRRWLRVSLRTLMVLVLLVGVGVGWYVNRVRTQRLAVAAIEAAGGSVFYDDQFSTNVAWANQTPKATGSAAPAWLRRWLGDDFFGTAVLVRLAKAVTPEVLAAVAGLDGLVSLLVIDTAGLDNAWPVLERLTRLEEIHLVGSGVTDSALATIGRLTPLRSVRLFNAPLTDSGMKSLANLPNLHALLVGGCTEVTDAGMARFLADLRSPLEDFSYSQFRANAPRTVQALTDQHRGLRRLSFHQSPIADADLAPIGKLTGLTHLNLQQTKITDAGVAHLGPLRKLEFLVINLPGVTDAAMPTVGRFVNLDHLDLSGSQVSDAGLAELTGLRKLKVLRLHAAPVTDLGAESLGHLSGLEVLVLDHTKLTDAALGPLGSLKRLQRLDVRRTRITAEGVAALRQALPSLARVQLGATAALAPPPPAK